MVSLGLLLCLFRLMPEADVISWVRLEANSRPIAESTSAALAV